MPRAGQIPLTLVSLMTSLGPFIADFNETHVYHPGWMPHAKFHNGQNMSMGALLGLLTLWYTWFDSPERAVRVQELKGKGAGKGTGKDVEAQRGIERTRLRFVVVLASLYWVTQLMAWFYPGALAVDPPGDPNSFPQLYISGFGLSLTALGWWLEKRSLGL